MIDTLLIDRTPRQTRTALLAAGRVAEVLMERPAEPAPRTGDVYLGRVVGLAGKLGGGFVDLGGGAIGFIRDRSLREGEALAVQVAAVAVGDKGARLTRRIALTGRGVVIEPWGSERQVSRRIAGSEQRRLGSLLKRIEGAQGVILRSAAAAMTDAAVLGEAAVLMAEGEALRIQARSGDVPRRVRAAPIDMMQALHDEPGVRRVVAGSPDLLAGCRDQVRDLAWAADIAWEVSGEGPALFEVLGVESAIEHALERRVSVNFGIELGFAAGAALTAVDVDSAAASDRGALDCNLAAARAIPAELRLRGIAGLVVVDFIGLDADREKRAVMTELAAAAALDRQITACNGLSALGLAEIARRRTRASLAETMSEACPHCADGHHPAPAAVADAIVRRIARDASRRPGAATIICADRVAAALRDPMFGGIAAIAALAGGPVTLRPEVGDRADSFDVAWARP